MNDRPNSLAAIDRAALLHPFTDARDLDARGPQIMTRAEGVRIWDDEGREYIDGLAGLWSMALGYSQPRLRDAVLDQMDQLPFYHTFTRSSNAPSIRLAEKLVEMTPAPLSRVFFSSSGSEANDTVVKLVWFMNNAMCRPEKKKFLARDRAYHGVTVAAGSLTGLPANHRDFDLPAIPVVRLSCPDTYRNANEGESDADFAARMVAEAEETILREGPETIAAFIGEPLMGAGGVIPAPEGYWQGIEALCRKHDILLVADEVITGFGRLGSDFGCNHYGFTPDIMVMSKQLTSSYLPLAAVLMSDAVYQPIAENSGRLGTLGHGFTASGHPVSCRLALENLAIIEEQDLTGNAARQGIRLHEGLQRLTKSPIVGNVRGAGLIAGIELVADKATRSDFGGTGLAGKAAQEFAREEGLIFRSVNDILALCPPLVVTETDIEEILARLGRIVERIEDWAAKAGVA